MDNLPAHKLASIKPMIESGGHASPMQNRDAPQASCLFRKGC